MPAIKKYHYPTKMWGCRINAEIKDNYGNQGILKDLGEVFNHLASRFTQKEIDELLAKHQAAKALIEVIPDEA